MMEGTQEFMAGSNGRCERRDRHAVLITETGPALPAMLATLAEIAEAGETNTRRYPGAVHDRDSWRIDDLMVEPMMETEHTQKARFANSWWNNVSF